jgi:hypothetical protein
MDNAPNCDSYINIPSSQPIDPIYTTSMIWYIPYVKEM